MIQMIDHIWADDGKHGDLRTEDIRFSPSGRLLAIASATTIILLQIDPAARPIRVLKATTVDYPGMAFVHGIDFISDALLVVADREAWVTFHQIPPAEIWEPAMVLPSVHEMGSAWFGEKALRRLSGDRIVRCGPGSVRIADGTFYVATINRNTVTRHAYSVSEESISTGEAELVAQDAIEIPDGIALTRTGDLLAVSNSAFSKIFVYNTATRNLQCVLRDPRMNNAHGLCFDASGSTLYAVDAGQPFLYGFHSRDGWKTSVHAAACMFSAFEQQNFALAKQGIPPQIQTIEGGLKGIDIDPTGHILAVTARRQTLRFFDISRVAF